jgi:thiamine-monophosphate kinase
VGIGDDTAWVTNKFGSSLITADLLIERIHFDLKWTSLFDLGYKTLAVNLSDIAAMGGTPAYLILSLAMPADFDSKRLVEFYRGIHSLAAQTGVALIGGDTSLAPLLIIAPCLIGHAPYSPVRRSGAKSGHDIYVTGTLGDSALGLELLREQECSGRPSHLSYLLSRHHRPTPRLRTGTLLARERLATAMIDISDGLIQDLGHICKASGVGAALWEHKLPLSRAYRALARHGSAYALTGGEDYELLFCARPRDRARIEKLQKRANVAITRVGRCVSAKQGLTVLDASGRARSIRRAGYDHFKAASSDASALFMAGHRSGRFVGDMAPPSGRANGKRARIRDGAPSGSST